MQDFTKMRAWIAARDLYVEVYKATQSFPKSELFGLTSQMRGAARSVAADIAEGSGYSGELDSARFYRMGFGSSSEVYSDMHLARAVKLLSEDKFDRLEAAILPTRKQLSRLSGIIESRAGR